MGKREDGGGIEWGEVKISRGQNWERAMGAEDILQLGEGKDEQRKEWG